MPIGPGKYDPLATYVRVKAAAEAVALIVINGNQGSGFSVQSTHRFLDGGTLVKLLRDMADQIEETLPGKTDAG
jgi:hypothetical protein